MHHDLPPPKPGYVRRTSPVFWEAGAYDFDTRPTYAMTPADNRRAVEQFRPVPLRITHQPNPLDGKLGEVVALFPAAPDYSRLGYHADLPEWLDRLYRDENGKPLPLPVSASWGYGDKLLRHVGIVNEPRIPEAAMFEACFEATGDPVVGMALNRASTLSPDATDPGAIATLEVQGDEESLRFVKGMAERMGCTCEIEMEAPEPEPEPVPAPPPVPEPAAQAPAPVPVPEGEEDEMSTQTQAAFEARLAALERENARLRKADQDRQAREREASFERRRADARREAEAFAKKVVPSRVLPYQVPALVAEYVQAALDDARWPEEVHFEAINPDGTVSTRKGTRVQALEARYLALPDNGLLGERVPDRAEASFDVDSGRVGRGASPATVNRILASTDLGKAILRDRANGRN